MGSHLIMDFVGVTKVDLNDIVQVDELLSKAVSMTDCTIISK